MEDTLSINDDENSALTTEPFPPVLGNEQLHHVDSNTLFLHANRKLPDVLLETSESLPPLDVLPTRNRWNFYRLIEQQHPNNCDSPSSEAFAVSKDNLFKMCNGIKPNSACPKGPEIRFGDLDLVSQRCYGVFGQEGAILRLLRELGVSDDEDETRRNFSAPGIYAVSSTGARGICSSTPASEGCEPPGGASRPMGGEEAQDSGDVVVVVTLLVLWPEKDAFSCIHSENVTTTWLTYLAQLSKQVIVCLDEECAGAFPEEQTCKRSERVQMYKIERRAIHDEDFKLHESFHLFIGALAKEQSTLFINSGPRAAIVTSKRMPRRKQHTPWKREIALLDLDRASLEITEAFRTLNARLDERMPLPDQLVLFRHMSPSYRQRVQDLEDTVKSLRATFATKIELAHHEIDSAIPQFEDMLTTALRHLLRNKMIAYWPKLGASMGPEVSYEDYQSCRQFLQKFKVEPETIIQKDILCGKGKLLLRISLCVLGSLHAGMGSSLEYVTKCLDFRRSIEDVECLVRGCPGGSANTHAESFVEVKQMVSDGMSTFIETKGKADPKLSDSIGAGVLETLARVSRELLTRGALNPGSRKVQAQKLIEIRMNEEIQRTQRELLEELQAEALCPGVGERRLCIDTCRIVKPFFGSVPVDQLVLLGRVEEIADGRVGFFVHEVTASVDESEEGSAKRSEDDSPPRVKFAGQFELPASGRVLASSIVDGERALVVQSLGELGGGVLRGRRPL